MLIIVAVFATRAILNNNSSDNQQTNNASNDNNVSKDYKNEVQNQSDNIKQQVEDAKNDIKDKVDTDSRIKQIQEDVNNLKNSEQTGEDSKLTKFYQEQVHKLKEANNAQQNNESQSKVNDLLNDVNTKFDEIKEKLNSILGNSSDTNSQ